MKESFMWNAFTGISAFVIVLVIYDPIFGTYKDFGEQMLFALINGTLLGIVIGKLKPSLWTAAILSAFVCMGTSSIKLLLEGVPEDWAHGRALYIVGSYYWIPGIIVGCILGYHHQISKDL